ncbi:MAG: hypothetical protein ABR915_04385 [Thermoguttaceae bacterium]|jgi:hypothetical protein
MSTSARKTILTLGAALAMTCLLAAIAAAAGPAKPDPAAQKPIEVVIEWGFPKAAEALAFDGRIEATQNGVVEKVAPLPGDTATRMAGPAEWKSPASGGTRRGVVASLRYGDAVRGPARTIITVRTGSGSFSFQPVDLKDGPILAPEYGFFVAETSANVTAASFQKELATKGLKTIRQKVREHPEQTWEGAVRALHGAIQLPPMPEPAFEPAMSVEVPDKYLTGLWRLGAWGIIRRCPRISRADLPQVLAKGDVPRDCKRVDDKDPDGVYVVRDNPFPPLGCETDRILWALDHLGMHHAARDGISVWLEGQQKDGALSLNSGMERAHKVGALQLLWVMAEHYRLTGDKEWLRKEAPRLKAAVDWILARRSATMKQDLTQAEIEGIKTGKWSPYGLQPKVAMGDGDPSGSRYYYWADSSGYQSVKLFADVVADVDPQLGVHYAAEAEKYRKDILPVLNESIVLSPVMKVRDGTYRSFHPQGFQDRGPLARVLPEGANIYSHCGPYHADYCITCAAIEAWLRTGLLSVDDVRIDGHFDVVEDVFLLDHPWFRKRKKDYDPEKDWFAVAGWGYQSGWERMPDYYLVKDDVPNFIRSWLNHCAVDLNFKDYSFNEHTTFAANDKSHGRAVFLSNFRNMLVTEIGDGLWVTRATPRAWLEQGKKISVKNAPTYYGTVAYEIVSDVDNGKISATVEMPSRKAPKEVTLRLRHPKAAPIKSVTVNGKPWSEFNTDKETITLKGLAGTVTVTAQY